VLDIVSLMDRSLYPQYTNNWDDHIFRNEIMKVLQADYHILDLGAGAGRVAQMNFRGLVTRVCGIDPDPRVGVNPYLDEGKVAFGEDIPYADTNFDIVFATAHDQYAIRAIKFTALDYLLKPIDSEQLVEAVKKASLKNDHKAMQQQYDILKQNLASKNKTMEQLAIPSQQGLIFIKVDGNGP